MERDGSDSPVDRRMLSRTNRKDWTLNYLKALLADQRIDNSRHARIEARLYRTQYRAPGAPDARARYGLACMLSRLASQAHDQKDLGARDSFLWSAAAQLERSLSDSPGDRREGLAEWARLDPDLKGLQEHAGPMFETIVARWGPAERRPVERTKLDSSGIVSVGYKAAPRILELQFEDGSRYQYFDVSEEAYNELIRAKSPDEVFDEKIEPTSAFVRI
ncbi:MAG TPA: KTSC domain-containing protein [Solirubrobacterales bacterium]|nr:KTSC domain-containing protein [Solirubrobacterales bacterium]